MNLNPRLIDHEEVDFADGSSASQLPLKFKAIKKVKKGYTHWTLRVFQATHLVKAFRNNQYIFSCKFQDYRQVAMMEEYMMSTIDEVEGAIQKWQDEDDGVDIRLPKLKKHAVSEVQVRKSKKPVDSDDEGDGKKVRVGTNGMLSTKDRQRIKKELRKELEEEIRASLQGEIEQEVELIEKGIRAEVELEMKEQQNKLEDQLREQMEAFTEQSDTLNEAYDQNEEVNKTVEKLKRQLADEEKSKKDLNDKLEKMLTLYESEKKRYRELIAEKEKEKAREKAAVKKRKLAILARAAWEKSMKEALSPLNLAIKAGDKRQVKKQLFFHLENPDDTKHFVNMVDESKKTPIIHSVQFGNAAISKILLAAGAEPNAVDGDGNTAIHYAAQRSDNSHIKLLMRYKGNPHIKNKDNQYPWQMSGQDGFIGAQVHSYIMQCEQAGNNPPKLNREIANQSCFVGQVLSLQLPKDTFVDDDGDALEYAATGMPTSIRFNAKSRKFVGACKVDEAKKVDEYGAIIPTDDRSDWSRVYIITVTASDEYSQASTTFELTVYGSNEAANNPPEVKKSIPSQHHSVDEKCVFCFDEDTFFDEDGDVLKYTAEGLPDCIKFIPEKRTFEGFPSARDALEPDNEADKKLYDEGKTVSRDYEVVVTAADDFSTASTAFILTFTRNEKVEEKKDGDGGNKEEEKKAEEEKKE